MKLEVGMYCRHKSTIIEYEPIKINKIIQIIDTDDLVTYHLDNKDVLFETDIIKASHNIIDLIEKHDILKHDILRILEVKEIDKENKIIYFYDCFKMDIKDFQKAFELNTIKILTREQFENNCYKIGD